MNRWRSDTEESPERGKSGEKSDADLLLANQDRADTFLQAVVLPAFKQVAEELQRAGRETSMATGHRVAGLLVIHDGQEEFEYIITLLVTPQAITVRPRTVVPDPETGQRIQNEVALREGRQGDDVETISKEEIRNHFFVEYKRRAR
jgi:hypothetical protein